MRTTIDRVVRAACARPWAIQPEKLEEIAALLELRANAGELTAEEIQARIGSRPKPERRRGGGVAVLPVFGVISQRMDLFTQISGGTSVENFRAQFEMALDDDSIETIVLDVDSPGGTVTGVPEMADIIYRARGKKRVIAVANGLAASAAYWLGSAADEFVVIPSGEVGSIGVFILHTEISRAEDAAGITRTFIRAGRYKAEANPHEPLTEEAKAALQAGVDEFYEMFTTAVAKHRGVKQDAVKNGFGQGRVVLAKAALAEGMVDRIATLEEVLEGVGVSRSRLASAQAAGFPLEPVSISIAAAAGGGAFRWAGIDREPTVHAAAGPVEPLPPAAQANPPAQKAEAETAANDQANDIDTGGDPGAPAAEEIPRDTTAAPQAAKETAMSDQDKAATQEAATTTPAAGTATVTAGEDRARERARSQAISELCSAHGAGDRTTKFIADGYAPETVASILMAEATQKLRAMTAPAVDLPRSDARRYSITRAIMGQVALANGDGWEGLEKEVHESIAANLPKDYKSRGGVFIPTRGTPLGMPRPQAALDSGTATAGQELKFTEAGDFIDMLRARMKAAQLGATILTGLQGPVAFPKQSGAGSWTWVAEDPGSDVADSDLTLTQVALNPKAGQSSTAFARQLLAQSSIDVDNMVQNDLALIAALGIDAAAIAGTGASNAPTGVLNTTGIGSVAIGTNGGVPTYANVVDLETEVAVDNADIGSMAYLTTPGIRGKLKKTEEFSGSNGRPVWTGGMEGECNGYPGHVSTQVPSNLTKGTSSGVCHAIIFGVWAQLLIGYWGAYELVVDPYSKKKQGLIELTSFQMAGVAVRYPEAFAAVKDATLS